MNWLLILVYGLLLIRLIQDVFDLRCDHCGKWFPRARNKARVPTTLVVYTCPHCLRYVRG